MHLGILSIPTNFHCEKWAQAIAKTGAQVTVFSFEAGEIPGVETVRLAPPIGWWGRYRYPSYRLTGKALNDALKKRGVQVLHPLHLTPFGTWGVETGFRPMISAAMGADVLEYPPSKSHQGPVRTWREAEVVRSPLGRAAAWALNRYYRGQVQRVIRESALVTADNQPLVDALKGWFSTQPRQVRLLRWGLEPELLSHAPGTEGLVRAKFGIPAGARVVLSPRGANALYQADVILEAFATLLATGPTDVCYLMLGAGYALAGPVAQRAKALAEAHPGRLIYVAQQLPRLEVYALWSVVDVFVSAPVYDGYSAAIAEGRYVGAVPVVNAIPGNLEVIGHKENGWVVEEPFSAGSLTEALTQVLDNLPALKAAFAPHNRAWIEAHSLLHRNAGTLVSWAEEVHGNWLLGKAG